MFLSCLKSLSDATRLRLLSILDDTECTVQELTAILAMGQSRVSRHLKIMLDAGLVEVRRQGTWSYYRIATENELLHQLWPYLKQQIGSLPAARFDKEHTGQILERRRHLSLQFFDQVATSFERLSGEVLPMVEYCSCFLAQIERTGTLVEVGIGTGSLLVKLASLCRQLIGIDQSPAMLEAARERLAREQIRNCELRLGEMSFLPLADGSVDLVVLNMVLHHAPSPPAVLAEVVRVLAADGRILLADLTAHEQDRAREQLADQWLGFAAVDLQRWLRDAGFILTSEIKIDAAEGLAGVLIFAAQKNTEPAPLQGAHQGVKSDE